MYRQELKIPKERVGVLIGKKGEVKRQIEDRAGVKLDIDSKQGEVIISGEDSVALYNIKKIISAIGRGFTPDEAMVLFNENYVFEIMEVQNYSGKSKKKMDRLRGRVIGEQGKSRKVIEHLTETTIVVYGKTVGIIGEAEHVSLARKAVDMLLGGAPHGAVYQMLERKRRDLHRREFEHGHA